MCAVYSSFRIVQLVYYTPEIPKHNARTFGCVTFLHI